MDVTSSVPESYVLRSKNSDVDKQVDELLGRMQDKPEDSRPVSYTHLSDDVCYLHLFAVDRCRNTLLKCHCNILTPVSYTHLDVYKRQLMMRL